jgi:hypothetical protein
MNKKYLIIGALLLVGGYIAYKKFYVKKDSDATDSGSDEKPVNRGIVPPVYEPAPAQVSESAPTLVVPSSTTSVSLQSGKPAITDNVVTASQNLPSNFTYAGLGKY